MTWLRRIGSSLRPRRLPYADDAAACGVSFAAVQFYVSNFVGPELTDIMSSLTCIGVMILVLKLWKPREIMRLEGDKPVAVEAKRYAESDSGKQCDNRCKICHPSGCAGVPELLREGNDPEQPRNFRR